MGKYLRILFLYYKKVMIYHDVVPSNTVASS